MKKCMIPVICSGLLVSVSFLGACSRKAVQAATDPNNPAVATSASATAATPGYPATPGAAPVSAAPVGAPPPNEAPAAASAPAAPPSAVLEAGTAIRVRLQETLDTRRNRAGDRFSATLDEPLVSGDRVVVPRGTIFHGHVTQSKESGRFKGRAILSLRLDSFTLDGRNVPIESGSVARASRKKHGFGWIGGGTAGGALIGALAGGGKGAAIGAGAGAASGVVGSAVTGRREVALPVESEVRFTLRQPVTLGF